MPNFYARFKLANIVNFNEIYFVIFCFKPYICTP